MYIFKIFLILLIIGFLASCSQDTSEQSPPVSSETSEETNRSPNAEQMPQSFPSQTYIAVSNQPFGFEEATFTGQFVVKDGCLLLILYGEEHLPVFNKTNRPMLVEGEQISFLKSSIGLKTDVGVVGGVFESGFSFLKSSNTLEAHPPKKCERPVFSFNSL